MEKTTDEIKNERIEEPDFIEHAITAKNVTSDLDTFLRNLRDILMSNGFKCEQVKVKVGESSGFGGVLLSDGKVGGMVQDQNHYTHVWNPFVATLEGSGPYEVDIAAIHESEYTRSYGDTEYKLNQYKVVTSTRPERSSWQMFLLTFGILTVITLLIPTSLMEWAFEEAPLLGLFLLPVSGLEGSWFFFIGFAIYWFISYQITRVIHFHVKLKKRDRMEEVDNALQQAIQELPQRKPGIFPITEPSENQNTTEA